jgi:hypothetical protein
LRCLRARHANTGREQHEREQTIERRRAPGDRQSHAASTTTACRHGHPVMATRSQIKAPMTHQVCSKKQIFTTKLGVNKSK